MPDAPHIRLLVRPPRAATGRSPRDAAGDVWRRVLPRVAADRLGLELALAGCTEGEIDLPGRFAVDDDAVLLALEAGGRPAGLAVVDATLRAALIEVQTTGSIGSARIDPRPPTAVDAALLRHVLDDWLAAVCDARGEALPPAAGRAFPDLRAALLKLEEGPYRETRLDLDLGGGRRTGVLRLLLASPGAAPTAPGDSSLREALLPVEGALDAVLGRITVPLATVLNLAPGDVLPLAGLSVRSIRLEAPLGRFIAPAHLGQSGGHRAVRILPPDSPKAHAAAPRPVPSLAASGPAPEPEDLPDLPMPASLPMAGLPPLPE